MARYAQGKYTVKNPEKYVGKTSPTYRSGWEFTFCKFCDENVHVLKWASESIRISYRNPFTGKHTIYVPDFFINYIDAAGKQHAELIEVKPANQQIEQKAIKNKSNYAHWILNQAKWEAANAWCRENNLVFRIINENDMFHNGTRK
jgi:hypothetical protein